MPFKLKLPVSPAICEGDSFRTKTKPNKLEWTALFRFAFSQDLKSHFTSRSLRIIALYAGGQIDFKYESNLAATWIRVVMSVVR